MTQGLIRRLVRERIERRDDARLPSAWVELEHGAVAPSGLSWLVNGEHAAVREAPGAAVLVMLGANPAAALNELDAHASAGARVYVLVGPDGDKGLVETGVLQAPNILFRRLAEVPATAVHTAVNPWVWLGGGWRLRLDGPQAEALRHTFLRLFWHDATEEAWSGGRVLSWRPAGDRPFDVPEPSRSASVGLRSHDARLLGDGRGAAMYLTGGIPPDVAPRRLWFPAGPTHQGRLAQLAREGAEVVWQELNLPDILVGTDGGEVLLPGTRARLRLHLTAAQASEVHQLLEASPRWSFLVDVCVGDPALRAGSFWLSGEANARGLEAEQFVELPDVAAPALSAVPDTAPSSVPVPQPLALSVRYRWTVVPPRVPGGTEEDALLGRWRRLDQEWTSRLERARQALQATEGERGRIGRAFSRLVSALLGFERTHEGLAEQVRTLEVQLPSGAGPDGAKSLLVGLAVIEERVGKLQGDLDEAERKAREDEEREKQEAAWRARVNSAEHSLKSTRKDLAQAEDEVTSLESRNLVVRDQMTSADEARKLVSAENRRASATLAKAKQDAVTLQGQLKELERRVKPLDQASPDPRSVRGGKPKGKAKKATVPPISNEAAERDLILSREQLASCRKQLAETEARLGECEKECRVFDERLKAADAALGDLNARRRSLSDELIRANNRVTRLRGEIGDLETRASERFEFRPPASLTVRLPQKSGGRFVPPTSSARPAAQVPDEALPEVGALRSLKGQRYLVIQTWEELLAGEQSATRLFAKLVAPENV